MRDRSSLHPASRRDALRAGGLALAAGVAGCGTGLLGSPTESPTPSPPAERWRISLDTKPNGLAVGRDYLYAVFDGRVTVLTTERGVVVGSLDVALQFSMVVPIGDVVVMWTDAGVVAYDRVLDERRWQVEGGGSLGAVISHGVVVERRGRVEMRRLRDGAIRWRFDPPTDNVVVHYWNDELLLFSGTVDGTITHWAVDASDGDRRWRARTPDAASVLAPMEMTDGTLYVGSSRRGPGRILALRRTDGGRRWETDLGDGRVAPVDTVGDVLLAGTDGTPERLFGLATSDGHQRWTHPGAWQVLAVADTWFLASRGGRVFSVAADGTRRWVRDLSAPPTATAAAPERALRAALRDDVVVQHYGSILGLDPASGDRRWRYDHGRLIDGWWFLDGDVVVRSGARLFRIALPQ